MNLIEMYSICSLECEGFIKSLFIPYLVLLTEWRGLATSLNNSMRQTPSASYVRGSR